MVDRGPGADLDSRAPDWGQADVSADVDLRITRLSDPPLAATSVVVLPGGSAPDYERCAAATGYDDQIMDAEIDVRASFCIRTSEGRLAHVTITDVSQRSDQVVDTITFEATTWEA
jgi:hypothetical protein